MRTISRFSPQVARVRVKGALLIVVSMLLASFSLAAGPSQAGVSWDYRLLGKLNSAKDPKTGWTIVITGSGSFDKSQGSISGGGGYTILDEGGSVVGSDTWTAKNYISFDPMGPGKSPGEGGHLELEAWFNGEWEGALKGYQHVVIVCAMWGDQVGPPGYPWPPDFATVGPYTDYNPGAVMFNLNQ